MNFKYVVLCDFGGAQLCTQCTLESFEGLSGANGLHISVVCLFIQESPFGLAVASVR